MKYTPWILCFFMCMTLSCKKPPDNPGVSSFLQLVSVSIGPEELDLTGSNEGFRLDQPVVIRFSQAVDKTTVAENILLTTADDSLLSASISYLDEDRTISLRPEQVLNEMTQYFIDIKKDLKGSKGEVFSGLSLSFTTLNPPLKIVEASINDKEIAGTFRISDIDFRPEITVKLNPSIDPELISTYSSLQLGSVSFSMDVQSQGDTVFTFKINQDLPDYRKFTFRLSANLGTAVEREFDGFEFEFYTKLDSTYKFPPLSDEELLDKIQEQTFRYFWDFGHPVSGLSRERNTSYETVTSGGSGFGLMAFVVGMERQYISRAEGLERIDTIVEFLERADRFHGVWPHWMNGTTGKVIPFSANDDGGDIVETSYLVMGLLTVRQYLSSTDSYENSIIEKINSLVAGVEWDWYRQGGQNVLYWHWSPNYEWEKNHKLTGYNEALITYIIAASSGSHGIPAEVYHEGWARNGDIVNGQYYIDILLPLGNQAYGGPLFFEQYTYLGINPSGLSDSYADYNQQVINHTLINRAYCISNPKNYIGYSESCWGLTASDGNTGYSAHSPTNDRGVITPTAAISSIPFTPDESLEAIRHFYYLLGDKLWGEYGFYDAFNVTENWYASSYIAIDQGPIILMIENYRTGLLWNLFMSCPEIQNALDLLGFTY